MSTASKKKQSKANPVIANGEIEGCMRLLMSTVRMVQRFGTSKFAEIPHLSKLSGARVSVLFIVQSAGAIRMGDLATKLVVAPRTVTDLVDALERDGFLRRIPDPTDRRATLIEITPERKPDFDNIAVIRKQFLEETFSVLSTREQEELKILLEKLQRGPLAKFAQAADFIEEA